MKTFKDDIELAEYIRELGGVLYLVGGAVRNKLLGIEVKDKDYVVTGVDINDIPFDKVAGVDFPVFLVDVGDKVVEVAMARTERKSGRGYHGFTVYTDTSVRIEDDLLRRDLTMNSIAMNVLTGELIDPYGGGDDVENKVIRYTSESFKEDPLRVYRVARFYAEYPFMCVTNKTMRFMSSMKEQLRELTPERVWKEVEKVLVSKKPSNFFRLLKELDLLDIHFPEVSVLDVADKHDGTTFEHTMALIDVDITNTLVKFGLLVHDFGKGLTPKRFHPAHYNHDKLGKKPVNDFCDRLKIPNKYREFGVDCATQHMNIKNFQVMRSSKILRFVEKYRNNLNYLLCVSVVDSVIRVDGMEVMDKFEPFKLISYLIGLALHTIREVMGKTLIEQGYKPGKHFKELLLSRRVEYFNKFR
ncbi:MAG: hypothetical protein WC939_04015 [Acholeplasmataceae bacterium]